MKNGFLKVFINEIHNLWNKPKRLFYALIFPLIIIGYLSSLFYQGIPRDLPVAYIDNDQTQTSAKLVRMLDASPSMRLVLVPNIYEAKHLLQTEKVYAIVEVPKDFQKNLYLGKTNEVINYTNNQFILPAGLIQKDFQQVIGVFSAGIKINKDTQNNVQLDNAMASVQPILVDEHQLYNPYSNYSFYLLTSLIPMMLQMIAMMVTLYVVGIEFKHRTAFSWYKDSNKNAIVALLGKLLPYTLCLFFLGWWMNYLLFIRIGTPLKTGMINVTLMTFLLIIVYQMLAIFILSIFNNFRSALTIGSGYTAIAFSFTAYTFPIEGLPKSMQFLSEFFPLTHFLKYYVERAIKGVPIEYSYHSILIIAAFSLLFFVAAPLFVKRLKSGGYEQNV